MNVYLVRDMHPGTGRPGVLAFDAGVRQMAPAIAAHAAALGGLTRVVLGHAHIDHRGAAPRLGVPVLCHADERADAESDGGTHYYDSRALPRYGRIISPPLIRLWDGGPVTIAATLAEGDEIAGFEVIHLPGHAPGLIALWRAHDRLALSSDCFYTLDPLTGRHGPPRVPHRAFNHDTEQAARVDPQARRPGTARRLARTRPTPDRKRRRPTRTSRRPAMSPPQPRSRVSETASSDAILPPPMTASTTRTRRAPTQERGRRTVQKILDATEQIIAENGIDAANTRAIADRAGVVVPSLYHFFADRDEILDALVQHMLSDLDQQAEAAEAAWKPGDQDLIGIELDLHANYFKSHPVAARCGSADAHPPKCSNPSTTEATNSPPASGHC